VRIVLSHSGGSTPYLAARVAGLCAFHLGCELSPEEIIADFRTFYYETALSGFETNLVALENFVESDHILFGTDFPAVSPQTAGWYTNNVDTYFQARPDLLAQVMHGNAHSLPGWRRPGPTEYPGQSAPHSQPRSPSRPAGGRDRRLPGQSCGGRPRSRSRHLS
jgi:hypothetical protein